MQQLNERKYSLPRLVWPIAVELLLFFLLGITDTLMVSRISDGAVGVVGLSNHFFEFVIVSFELICGGAGIVIAQRIGANRLLDARRAATMAFSLAMAVGLIVSVVIFFGASTIGRLLQMPIEFRDMGVEYIMIVGSSTFVISGMMALSAAIRNAGNTKGPMLISVGINILHVFGNYVFIFGALGFPQWGLTGVAISTVVSRVVGLLFMFLLFQKSFGSRIVWKEYVTFDKPILKEIGKIGLPMMGTAVSWSFSQLVIIAAIASMGTVMLATKTYMNIMESFVYLAGWSFAVAVQIQVGYLYGANKHDAAYRSPFIAFRWGLLITMINVVLLLLFGREILNYLTDDPEIIKIGSILLWINILLQPLKFMNMPVSTSLNAVGDSKYLMKISIPSMWLIAVGGTFLLGKGLDWMIFGVYIAMMSDELVRGILVFRRWMSKVKLNIE